MTAITRIFDFEMAHSLYNFEGPCAYIHGQFPFCFSDPLILLKGINVFKLNSFQTVDFGFRDFEIGKPGTI